MNDILCLLNMKFQMIKHLGFKYIWNQIYTVYIVEGKINVSKIGSFGYKFDTLETNWED